MEAISALDDHRLDAETRYWLNHYFISEIAQCTAQIFPLPIVEDDPRYALGNALHNA